MGTAGLRIASNSAAFVDAVRARSGIDVEVISGEEEARLAYVAAISGLGLGSGSLVVFDTGGGSSQFTFGDGTRVDERFSVNVGAVRFTEQFGLDGVVSDDAHGAGARGDLGRPRTTRRTVDAGGTRRDGRCRHEPRRGEARACDLRSRRRAGRRPRPRGDRPPDRALPHAYQRAAPRASSACSPNGRT